MRINRDAIADGLFWWYICIDCTRVLGYYLSSVKIQLCYHLTEDIMDINKLVEVLRATLQPDQRAEAEKHLAEVRNVLSTNSGL